jgi:hypothetical protein
MCGYFMQDVIPAHTAIYSINILDGVSRDRLVS